MTKKTNHPLIGKRCTLVPTCGSYQKDKKATIVNVTKTQIHVEADGEVNIQGEPHPPRKFKRSNFFQIGRQHDFPRYKITFDTDAERELAKSL